MLKIKSSMILIFLSLSMLFATAKASAAPIVSFPQDVYTVDEGYEQLSMSLNASSPDGESIVSVTLYRVEDGSDILIRKDTSVPYNFGHKFKPYEFGAMGWIPCDPPPASGPCHPPNPNPLLAGTHTFKAVVEDSAGLTGEATMTLIVNQVSEAPTVSFPQDVYTVDEGYEKLTVTLTASSPAGNDIDSVTLYRVEGGSDILVRKDTSVPYNFGHKFKPYEFGAMGWIPCDPPPASGPCHLPNPNPLLAGTHTFKAVVEDVFGLTGEATMTLIVEKPVVPPPTISFVESDVVLLEGYDSFSLSVDIETADASVSVSDVNLYINDNELSVRELMTAPYTWGGESNESELLGLTAGLHTFRAIVEDSYGNMGEVTTLIDVGVFGDIDADDDVDRDDMLAFVHGVKAGGITNLRYDFNDDDVVNERDVSGFARLCSRARCTGLPGPDLTWFYEQYGTDPTWAEVLASGSLDPIGSSTQTGVLGSTINVNNERIETGEYADGLVDSAANNYRIHTVGNPSVGPGKFHLWSRWYQEDGNTQIFRLFKDEENVRNSRALAARIEAFSPDDRWLPVLGVWREFDARFTVLKSAGCSNSPDPTKPHYCSLFQAKGNDVDDWSVMLRVHGDGSLWFYPREKSAANKIKIYDNVIGQPFDMRVRDNGLDYEMWIDGVSVGTGQWQRTPETGRIGFRWGIYVGATEVLDDILVLVTGVRMK